MKIKLNGFYYLNFTDFSYDQSLDSVASSFSLFCLMKAISLMILVVAFIVAFFTKINIAFIILGSGIIGIAELLWAKNKKQAGEVK